MIHACTVAPASEAAQVQVMAASFLRHNPGSTLMLVDFDGALCELALPGVETVGLEALGLDDERLRRAGLYLDPDELLAWMRPLTLAWALRGAPTAVWLDPSSVVLGPLDDVVAELATGVNVVTVSRTPIELPDDGLDPAARHASSAGLFATSLLAVTRSALPALRWWADRASNDTGRPPWLDQVVAHSRHTLLRDDGLAVSAWSIAGDVCTGEDSVLRLRGVPVRHMDLTGFDPERPWLLDGRPARPRVRLSTQPALARFCAGHAQQLLSHPVTAASRFATLSDGTPVTPQLRRLYRRAVEHGATEGPPQPFDPTDGGAFADWLLEPVVGSNPPLTRYLHSVYLDRPDLRDAMPGVPDRNTGELLQWAAMRGHHEPDYDPQLIDRSLQLAGRDRAAASRPGGASRVRRWDRAPRGVNVVGYLRGELGIGESARLMLAALSAAGIRHAATPVVRHLQSRQDAAFPETPLPSRPFDTTLLCVNADFTPEIAREIPELMRARHRIGMWYWEVEAFPASLHGAFSQVDEVWAATDFIRDALLPHATVPVHTVTPPLPVPARSTALTRVDLGLPDGYLFLFSFDYLSTAERKNPLGLVEAFRRAFPRGSGPVLVIKSINADERVPDAERLRTAVASEPDIVLMEDYLDAATRDALVVLTDCYVSLHRSEGLGLTMAEAMALGKPVIATGYGGNLQFMTEQNSYLVPWTAVPIPEGCAPYPPGTPWAQPDLDEAAARMRTVFDDPTSADVRGARAAHDIATRHSPDVAGRAIARQLRRSSPLRSMASRQRGRVRGGLKRS